MQAFLLRLLCAGALGLGAVAVQASAQTDADFFDDNILQNIKIVISPASWRDLQAHYLENIYYQAEFHWNFKGTDEVVTRVGIRSRGHGSRSPIKPNLHVSLGQYVSGQKFLGLSSFNLKANNQDASQQRERIVMNLFKKMGLPASRETHTRLYINDDYQGLYLLNEDVDKEYIQRYIGGGEGDGDLYEWKPIDNEPNGYHFEWRPTCTFSGQLACGTSSDKWAPKPFDAQENKMTFDIRPTIQFFRSATEASDADFPAVMADYTDLKLFMVHNGPEVYAADFDTILGDVFGANNFWIYRYMGRNLTQFLVWDKDFSFNWSTRPIFQNTDQNVLVRRSLALPDRRYQYLEAVHKAAILAGGAGGWMEWMNQRGYGQIRQAALDDPNKLWADAGTLKPASNDKFESEVVYNVQFVHERYPFVIAALTQAGFQLAPGGPTLGNGGAVNAATNLAGPVAPGSLVSLYGTALTSVTAQAAAVPLPTTLGNVTVYV